MHGVRHGVVYVFSVKKRIIRDLIILAGVSLVALVGCDRLARHKVLTFFFEGVPPLDSDRQAPDTETTVEEPPTVALVSEESARITMQTRASRHQPGRDCHRCHLKHGGWDRNRLSEPLPNLCHSCHTDYRADSGFLHGPVAVGECVFCHDPHQSKYVHLQKSPQPKLCYRCHIREDIESIANHQDKQHEVCTECHDPHIGPTRDLLKDRLEPEDQPNSVDLSE